MLSLFFADELSGEKIAVEVEPLAVVGDLEQEVMRRLGREDLPWLTFQGESLWDRKAMLADIGMTPQSVVSEESSLFARLKDYCRDFWPDCDLSDPLEVLPDYAGEAYDELGACTLLHRLASEGKAEELRLLVLHVRRLGLSSEADDGVEYWETPLYCCVDLHTPGQGHCDCLRALVELGGADVNRVRELDGPQTPCLTAAESGLNDILRVLIELGADVNKADEDGRTPCYVAAEEGHSDTLRVLIEAGADVNKADENGRTPCYLAVREGRSDILRVLIESGADVNKAQRCGRTPCYRAAMDGNIDALRVLIELGKADVNKADEDGRTPCYVAAEEGHRDVDTTIDVLRVLIEAGADVNTMTESGRTPCFVALEKGHWDAVDVFMVLGGVDVDQAHCPTDEGDDYDRMMEDHDRMMEDDYKQRQRNYDPSSVIMKAMHFEYDDDDDDDYDSPRRSPRRPVWTSIKELMQELRYKDPVSRQRCRRREEEEQARTAVEEQERAERALLLRDPRAQAIIDRGAAAKKAKEEAAAAKKAKQKAEKAEKAAEGKKKAKGGKKATTPAPAAAKSLPPSRSRNSQAVTLLAKLDLEPEPAADVASLIGPKEEKTIRNRIKNLEAKLDKIAELKKKPSCELSVQQKTHLQGEKKTRGEHTELVSKLHAFGLAPE